MGSLNKVMLIGRLGKDPEIRYTQSGSAVANFTIATSESWTDGQGQRQEKTEWHNIVAWNKLADLAQSYLKQGSMIYIEGRLQTQSWDDQQSGQKRYRTEINARTFQFLESRNQEKDDVQKNYEPKVSQQQYQESPPSSGTVAEPQNSNKDSSNIASQESPPAESFIEDDIPF